jgi:AcrR family transcriptional regulator
MPPSTARSHQAQAGRREVDVATRERMLEAAVASILERGFYRASSNEIARRAGVTWGVIQHHFGTREALLLAVLEDGANRFVDLVAGAAIDGATATARIDQLLELLAEHYGTPRYLAYLQILLNMDHDPQTSSEVRHTMRSVAERSNQHMRRLIGEALDPVGGDPDLTATVFLALRGFALSQQLLGTMGYDGVDAKKTRVEEQRRLLAHIIGSYLDEAGGGPKRQVSRRSR